MGNKLSVLRRKTSRRHWLTPGIGIKRWIVLLASGAMIAGIGIAWLLIRLTQEEWFARDAIRIVTFQFLPGWLRILFLLLIGVATMIMALVNLGKTLVNPFRQPGVNVAHSLYRYQRKGKGPRIVAIGGGTGMPNLLSGLSKYTGNITAIVTVADDGGSSGRIRRELGLLPPGDFRNNIAALAQDEALMTQLLQYRFDSQPKKTGEEGINRELGGHAFGNLLLAALAGVTGSFDSALMAAERVLAVQGQVLPSTLTPVILEASVKFDSREDPEVIIGESAITLAGGCIEQVRLVPPDVPAYQPAIEAILNADLVVIGPGSLYTSILPNLLVPGITRALMDTGARRIYVCNLATQPGETDNYSVGNHVEAINRHMRNQLSDGSRCLDVVLVNNNISIPPGTGGGNTIFVAPEPVKDIQWIAADLVDKERPWRHDGDKLANSIMDLT